MLPHTKKILGSTLPLPWYVLPVWVLSGYSSFLPQAKDVHGVMLNWPKVWMVVCLYSFFHEYLLGLTWLYLISVIFHYNWEPSHVLEVIIAMLEEVQWHHLYATMEDIEAMLYLLLNFHLTEKPKNRIRSSWVGTSGKVLPWITWVRLHRPVTLNGLLKENGTAPKWQCQKCGDS